MADRIVAEYGQTLRLNITTATLAGATSVEILVTLPTGFKRVWVPDVINTTDNYVTYTYRLGDLNYAGDYQVSVRIVYSPTHQTETARVVLVVEQSNWGSITTEGAPPPPPPVITTPYELWVASTGDDLAVGSEAEPLQTVQAAADRLTAWLRAGENTARVGIINFNEYFAEDVVFAPSVTPQDRIVFRGPDDGMTVLASGTLTAGSDVAFTDALATLGAANAYAGRVLRLTPPGGDPIYVTTRDHAATVLRPCYGLQGAPAAAGWAWALLAPQARIRSLTLILPWKATSTAGYSGEPLVVLHHFDVGPAANNLRAASLVVTGGAVMIAGVRVRGSNADYISACHFDDCVVFAYGPSTSTDPDPVFGLGAGDVSTLLGEGLACHGGYNNVRLDNGANFQGVLVCMTDVADEGNGLGALDGVFSIYGGAFINLNIGVDSTSPVPSSIYALTPSLPPLFRNCLRGVQVHRHGYIEVLDAEMRSIRESGFHARHMADLKLYGPLTSSAADLPVIGVHCRAGARVEMGPSFQVPQGSAQPVLCDELVSTSEAIFYHVPLLGDGHAVVERVEGYDLPLTGPLYVYVDPADPNATDLGAGLQTQPFVTGQAAASWMEKFIDRDVIADRDIFARIANGHLAEFIDFKPSRAPRRRVGFMGERDDMTIVASGTATAGDTKSLTDGGQTWTVNQWAGRWVKVYTAGGTELGLIKIRSNTATRLDFVGVFSFPVAALMTYEVVEPAVLIDGFRAVLPWVGSNKLGMYTSLDSRQPQFDLSYIQFGPWTPAYPNPDYVLGPLEIKGGVALLQAVRIVGTTPSTRIYLERTTLAIGGQAPVAADPVYGIDPLDWDWLYGAGVWLDSSELFTCDNSVVVNLGGVVASSGGFYLNPGRLYSIGGIALYGNSYVEPQEGAGAFIWADPSGNPNLASGITGTYAFRAKANSEVSIQNVELVGPFTSYAFLADQHAHLRIQDVTATGVIPYGIVCTRGSLVAVAPGDSFPCGGGVELLADSEAGTFAGIDVENLVGSTTATIVRDTQ